VIADDDLVLLDTNVLVEVFRNRQKGRWLKDHYLGALRRRPLLSIISVGEVLSIAVRNKYGPEKILDLNRRLSELVIVNVNRPVAESYSRVQTSCQEMHRPIGENDTWIAATALATEATLLTSDKDFEAVPDGLIKLELVSYPWQDGR